ncbi:T6SS effector amidase Tae4 family protein [Mixta tenebrionis]|uniref:T6SS effector amidase Tae4 family protein n=1 Tax=Mixta tenebrionis TaxID=2562439 RepID=UPI003CCC8D66
MRMSYVLNYTGAKISGGSWATVSGKDKNWYIYRVKDLLKYMHSMYGEPDKVVKNPRVEDFKGINGIMIFSTNDWSDLNSCAK